MWDSNAVYFSLTKLKIMASREIYSLKLFRMAYSKTCRHACSTSAFFDWFDWWTNQMYFTLTYLPVTCHMSFTLSFRYQTRWSVLSVCKIWAILFCIHLFFGSPLCLIMEKMNERSYFNVVSGSGKFIFAVSTGYLFGVCCNLCASDFTWPRAIVCLSGSSDSESELLCR